MKYIIAILCTLVLIFAICGMLTIYSLTKTQSEVVQMQHDDLQELQSDYHELALEAAKPRPIISTGTLILLIVFASCAIAARYLQNRRQMQRERLLLAALQAQQQITAMQWMQVEPEQSETVIEQCEASLE